jgi:hypothetical protein
MSLRSVVLLSEAGGKNLLQASHLNHSLEDSLKNTKDTKKKRAFNSKFAIRHSPFSAPLRVLRALERSGWLKSSSKPVQFNHSLADSLKGATERSDMTTRAQGPEGEELEGNASL